MKTTVHWIDAAPNVASGIQPVFVFERPLAHGTDPQNGMYAAAEVARVGKYYVLVSPALSPTPEFSLVEKDRYVRVPVSAYRTTSRALSAILATGLEVGISTALAFERQFRVEPQELLLVLGHECTDLVTENTFRCFVGIGFKI